MLEGWPDYGLVCTSFDYFRRAVDIAFNEIECFVGFSPISGKGSVVIGLKADLN